MATQVEQQVLNLTRQLDERLATLGGGEEIAQRVQEKVQAAMRRAEEAIAESVRNAEVRNAERRAREAERTAVRVERRHGRHDPAIWSFATPPAPPRPPKPQTPPVSEEERLMILRMVSEGKISVEQAEQLLAALTR